MADVEFKKHEYTSEMRRMKKTIMILVAVFVVLICFCAYVVRIKGTPHDFSLIHFNQEQLKKIFSHNKWPIGDNSFNVQEPDKNRKKPGYTTTDRIASTEMPNRLYQTLISAHSSTSTPSNDVADSDTKSDSFSKLRKKLKQLAKDSGLDVAGLLAKLWILASDKVTTRTPQTTVTTTASSQFTVDKTSQTVRAAVSENPNDRFETTDDDDHSLFESDATRNMETTKSYNVHGEFKTERQNAFHGLNDTKTQQAWNRRQNGTQKDYRASSNGTSYDNDSHSYLDSHQSTMNPVSESKMHNDSDRGPLYITRNLLTRRIQSLLEQRKLAKPEDRRRIMESIALLQSTLESLEWELKRNNQKHVNRTTAANSYYTNTTSTSSVTTVTSRVTTATSRVTTATSRVTTATSKFSETPTTVQTVKSHHLSINVSEQDITGDMIDLDVWQANSSRIINILHQLKTDPTKVDTDDLTKDVPGVFDCVSLKTVKPHPLICINNPNLDIPLSRSLKYKGLWETKEIEMFKTILRSNKSYHVIDLGSTLGVFTITAAAMGRSVVAVEPLQMNILPFHKTILFNRFPPGLITLVTNAITDYRGVAEMIYRPFGNLADARTSHLSLEELKSFSGNVHDLVRTITLDDLRKVVPFKSVVLKIDIQGDEYAAFRRAARFFDELHIYYVLMHWIPTENENGTKYISEFFSERGYKAKTSLNGEFLSDSELKHDHDTVVWIKQ